MAVVDTRDNFHLSTHTDGLVPGSPSETDVVRLTAKAEDSGIRLDQMLTTHLDNRTRSQIQRLIKSGQVHVGLRPARASTILHCGDVVTLRVPAPIPAEPSPEALGVEIMYDDVDIVVVNKPAGMVVHPAAGHSKGTLVNALLHQVKDLSGIGGTLRPGIVHRLDRGTSGVMVVAKHDQAHTKLSDQFKKREVEKTYIALVWGTVQTGRRVDLPIGRDPTHRKKMSARATRPRQAVTRVIKADHLKGVSLLHIAIDTGRTHQIRVHLNAIGHPVVGDPLYGGRRRNPEPHLRAVLKLNRPFLHATCLEFAHPRDGHQVRFISALPPDLESTLTELRVSSLDKDTKYYVG